MIAFFRGLGENLGLWIIAAICALVLILIIGVGFYLFGPIFSCIVVLVVVIAYSIVRYLMITSG